MKRFGITIVAVSLVALLSIAFTFAKENKKEEMSEKKEMVKTVKVSMADALAIATKSASGTVLNAELENENGKTIYSFEILPTSDSNVIKEINVDAASGAIVSSEEENAEKESKEKDDEMKESGEKSEKMSKESKENESEEGEKEEGEHGEKTQWKALKIKVDVAKLPAAVKSAATKEIHGGKIESATTMKRVYEVVVKSGNESSELEITADGKVIKKEKSGDEEKEEKNHKEKDEDDD